MAVALSTEDVSPEIEKLMTSTPSPTASSTALLISLLLPEEVPSALCHNALYIAMRAAGATPLNFPKSLPSTIIGTPKSPAAVLGGGRPGPPVFAGGGELPGPAGRGPRRKRPCRVRLLLSVPAGAH